MIHREFINMRKTINNIKLKKQDIRSELEKINSEQLDKKTLKEANKNRVSKNYNVKRKLKIKSNVKSKNFFTWLFSNKEK